MTRICRQGEADDDEVYLQTIRNADVKMDSMFSTTLRSFYPLESPGTHCT
jgi:hypothetical protein